MSKKDDLYRYVFCRYCDTILVASNIEPSSMRVLSEKERAQLKPICPGCKRLKSELAYNPRLRSKIQRMLADLSEGDFE